VELAVSRGIRTLAITDHDTTAAYLEASVAAAGHDLQLVGGIEASVSTGWDEVHMLGLGIDPAHPAVLELVSETAGRRISRARAIVAKLSDLGVHLDWEGLAARAGAVLTRPHIAAALVEGGFVPGHREAFDQYLAKGAAAHVSLKPIEAGTWIEAIHQAGGATFLAHPGDWTSHRCVKTLVASGLDGFEVNHPSHDAVLLTYYQEMADRMGLLCSGGSDFHGRWDGETERLGTYAPSPGRLQKLMDRILPTKAV
jgi:predicted metal-dependent phosphoesterase TrpH